MGFETKAMADTGASYSILPACVDGFGAGAWEEDSLAFDDAWLYRWYTRPIRESAGSREL